jgi:hypothetical protein
MGTPVAVLAYVNTVLYFIESPILSSQECSLYRRYVDDMFAALSRRHAIDFVRRFNATKSSIQLEAVTYELSGIFLDLDVSLVPSSRAGYSVFKHTIYQKPIYTNMIMIKNFVVKNTRYGLNQTSKFPDEIKSDINFSKRDTGNKTGSLKSGIET